MYIGNLECVSALHCTKIYAVTLQINCQTQIQFSSHSTQKVLKLQKPEGVINLQVGTFYCCHILEF